MIKSLTAENAHKLERVHELEAERTATAERNICEISMCQVRDCSLEEHQAIPYICLKVDQKIRM
jgi:hypothetical protein